MNSSHLPIEIWLKIIEYLPASFFQQDIRRLTISKCWYSLAYPIFFPEYTPKIISRFLHRSSKAFNKTRSIIQKSQQHVKVTLKGIPFRGNIYGISPDTATDLEDFGLILRRFSELEELTFVVKWPNKDWLADPMQLSYLPFKSRALHARRPPYDSRFRPVWNKCCLWLRSA